MLKWNEFVSGFLSTSVATLILISFVSTSGLSSVHLNPTAIGQNLSEVAIAKELEPNFDRDIVRLSQLENRFEERLPQLKDVRGKSRLLAPMGRISDRPYRSTHRPVRSR